MKSHHYSLQDTPEGRREKENYAIVLRADNLLKAGRIVEAGTIYKKVLVENEGQMVTAGAIAGLAEVARRSGDTTTALHFYRDLVYGKPGQTWVSSRGNDPVVRMKLALVAHDAGQTNEAWEQFQRATGGNQGWTLPQPPVLTRSDADTAQFPLVANLWVANRLQNFDPPQAAQFARDAVRANPTSGLPHYYLAQILLPQNQAEATIEFEKAVRYGHGEYVEKAQSMLRYLHEKPASPLKPETTMLPEPKPVHP